MTAQVIISAPQLNIDTVAAGGGSRLFWRNNMFMVGPESASAHPGPACYRKGGPLAITDANLQLGRLVPSQLYVDLVWRGEPRADTPSYFVSQPQDLWAQ